MERGGQWVSVYWRSCPKPQTKKGPCDLNYMDKLLPVGEGELNVLFGSKILLKGSVKSIKMYNIHANSIMRANVSLIYFLWYLGRACLWSWKKQKTNWGLTHIFIRRKCLIALMVTSLWILHRSIRSQDRRILYVWYCRKCHWSS